MTGGHTGIRLHKTPDILRELGRCSLRYGSLIGDFFTVAAAQLIWRGTHALRKANSQQLVQADLCLFAEPVRCPTAQLAVARHARRKGSQEYILLKSPSHGEPCLVSRLIQLNILAFLIC